MGITYTRANQARRTESRAAVMTTLASPTQGESQRLSLWRVEMTGGSTGPVHIFDTEQLWTVLTGALTIVSSAETIELGAGDTAIIPGGVERQVSAVDDADVIVCGFSDGLASVPGEAAPRGTPAWIR